MKLGLKEKTAFGIGAIGKDMVYMLSASYVLYYFQDILGVSAVAMGVILMAARIFDAFNDPIMGVVVAKTKTKWGKFRPWLLIGTLTNAVFLYLMFAAPVSLDAKGLVAYAAVTYIMWGVTYTMMDIPFWSMIPAFTEGGKERESLTTLARSCAGVGSAIVSIFTVKIVHSIGSSVMGINAESDEITKQALYELERTGFRWFALIVAVVFIVFEVLCCLAIKEKSSVEMETVSVGQMFKALIQNDQAMAVVVTLVMVNSALYITSNLVIYFFKYDIGGVKWYDNYTLFNTVGGGVQILAMMLLYPILRKFFTNFKIFYISIGMSILGYVILLVMASANVKTIEPLLIPAVLIMASTGINNVIVTIFLANTVDYGEMKNNRRDESVIFSMQTFVVKLASGLAIFLASIALQIFNLKGGDTTEAEKSLDLSLNVPAASKMGLRLFMSVLPILGLIFALFWFKKRYILTDEVVEDNAKKLKQNR